MYAPLTPLVDHGLSALARAAPQQLSVAAPAAGAGVPAAVAGQAARVQEIVQMIPRPNPATVSFMLVWLVSFIALQLCFGFALKATRKKG